MTVTAIVIHGNNPDDFQAYMAKESEGGNASSTQAERLLTVLPLPDFSSPAICSNVKELSTIKTLIQWEERGAGRVFEHHTNKGGKSHNWKHGEFSLIAGWKERKWLAAQALLAIKLWIQNKHF